tara:strand:+ start:664 stop:813 length:150 start_codon:yes stop_codon:yes gene_type:complete
MPKLTPIWEHWKKDPKKWEYFFLATRVMIILFNILVIIGFIMFIVLLVK